ncbi:M14 family zinc carboxypeptidase [Nocardioides sp. YIM 152588]|uniref:M14 family metallopeptidase n=1 Tax=Nocardioides sp. YIM 152588 TaxID=3158259 RepID=UPI0032E36E57
MHRALATAVSAAVLLATAALAAPPPTASAAPGGDDGALDAYHAKVSAAQLQELNAAGVDVTQVRQKGNGFEVDLVLDAAGRDKLRAQGVQPKLTKVNGKTVREYAESQAESGYTVWRDYDGPGGYEEILRDAAKKYPQITKLVKLGTTEQGRDLLALKVTQGARGIADGRRPAVIYSATQHAREWIAPEIDRRLMVHYLNGWLKNDQSIKRLLRSTELWFFPVMNPDGYQYTFTEGHRLWRKNLRDNDGDGQVTGADGVDPNRNYPEHWGYDEEGSSSIPSSQTYRGPSAASEPETQAMMKLLDLSKAEFQVNYHSNGEWLLYPEGWQIGSPTMDDPIYYALSGNLDTPAIEGYHPGLSSDVLYSTNGEENDYGHAEAGALTWTPELSPGCPTCGFVFPDDPALVEAEFQRNLPFARSVADSAADPANPKSVLGIETKPFYLKSEDAYKDGLPGANFTFPYSYGDPQPVQVLAQRSLGPVTLKYSINGGPAQSAPTSEWKSAGRYQPPSVYYHQLRGTVTGTDPGDSVEVWFEGGGETSDSFTYDAVAESGSSVLVVASEDYSGASPNQAAGPHYLDYYLDALANNGITADVYDVDAMGRAAPDDLGVLGHYDGVIWYSGDDVVTRKPGWTGGNADRLAQDEMLNFRSYLDEGGRAFFTGDWAGEQYTGNVGSQLYDPKGEGPCRVGGVLNPDYDPRRCAPLNGVGDGTNDVLQYWFGGYLAVPGDGLDANGDAYGVNGIGDPFTALTWAINGGDGAANQTLTSSFIATSGVLPVSDYPQFESAPVARYDKPGGPFDPHTGDGYVYSQIADVTYKQLSRSVDVPAAGGDLSFWTSYDTEADWDYLAVEVQRPDGTWTTLPDANGHTSQGTGLSCPSGWAAQLHPQLDAYQTVNGDGTCSPTGTTGEWNAASGNSGGWQEWSIDLSAFAGETVQVAISYISDWGTQNLGVFVDDVTLPDGTSTSFEGGDTGGWEASGPPEGSAPNANNWVVTDASGFPVGAVISTPHSLLAGFGFEAISTQPERDTVMARVLEHLLP